MTWPILVIAGSAAVLFFIQVVVNEFRLVRRKRQASSLLEGGKKRPGYLYGSGRRLP